jgi:MFS family permease
LGGKLACEGAVRHADPVLGSDAAYATAGLATAGFALAEALIGPQLAHLIGRFGQTRVLPFSLLAHGAAIAGVLASTTPAAAIVAATCAGAAVPQLGALSAARWAHLLRGERADELPSAFSLESLANATAFLLGPVLVTALGAVGDTALASAIAAALILGGGATLAAQRRTAPQPARESVERAHSERSSLLRPIFLHLALLNLAIGLYFGTMGGLGKRLRDQPRGARRGHTDHRRRQPQRTARRLALRAATAPHPGAPPT